MTVQARPLSVLPDGTPLYPVDWQALPPSDDLPGKAPRPEWGGSRVGSGTSVALRNIPPVKPAVGAVGLGLTAGVGWAEGSGPPAPTRGSGREIPAIQPPQPTGEPANALESPVNAPPPVSITETYLRTQDPPPSEEPQRDFLSGVFSAVAKDDQDDYVVERKRFYRRLETQSRLMTPEHHHMRYCLIFPVTNPETGGSVPPEVVLGKDGHWRRGPHKRCNCMGCLYCRLLHAMAARKKADKFLRGWHKRGSWCVMAAPTLSHPDSTEPYKQLSGQFKAALQKMRHGNVWERFEQKWGLGEWHGDKWVPSAWMYSMEDMINAFYGFHPHQHAMYEIVASYIAAHPELQSKEGRAVWEKAFQAAHYKLWESALKKVHRHASPTHGLIATLSTLSEREIAKGVTYITKAASELTGAPSKDGKNGSRDIYALLDDVEDESLPDETRELAGQKYVEYQRGIRRTTRYFFSENAAEETGVGESEVPELAEEPYTEVIMTMTFAQDQALMRSRAWPNFLTLGERHGVEVATAWLERFCPTVRVRGRPVFGEEEA